MIRADARDDDDECREEDAHDVARAAAIGARGHHAEHDRRPVARRDGREEVDVSLAFVDGHGASLADRARNSLDTAG